MSEEFGQITEKRRKFLKAVYDLAHGCPTTHVSKADVALRLGMDVGDREGFDEFMSILQYFDDLGCVCTFQSGAEGYREYGDLRITGQGIDEVEDARVRGNGGLLVRGFHLFQRRRGSSSTPPRTAFVRELPFSAAR